MARTFIYVGIALAVVVAAILIYAATKPDYFRVQRSASIDAPPEKIFPLINEFDRWSWSPYEHKDPEMKRTRSGPPSGKGAVYTWDGNSDVGAGRMEITESQPPSKVMIKLDFEKPMTAHNVVEFTLVPKGATTTVTWDMYGPVPYVAKIMHVFFDMDSMVGKDFEAGLAAMKLAAEK